MISGQFLKTLVTNIELEILNVLCESTQKKDILQFLPSENNLLAAIQAKIIKDRLLVIIRGLPGSGKTTLSNILSELLTHQEGVDKQEEIIFSNQSGGQVEMAMKLQLRLLIIDDSNTKVDIFKNFY